jgi:hypothetical protein
MSPDLAQLKEMHERTEQLRAEAADAEQAAYLRWQEAYGAYEVARDEASAAWTDWIEDPLARRPAGRAWKPRPAGRPAPPIDFRTRGAVMSLRLDEHAQKCSHRRLIRASAPDANGYRCCDGGR